MRTHSSGAVLLCAALMAAPITSAAEPTPDSGMNPELNRAQRLVFIDPHAHSLAAGTIVTYRFESTTRDVEAFVDRVEVRITGVRQDGGRDMAFDFLTGTRHIEFTPAVGYHGNPVIIQFLERDIRDMSQATGGYIGYFRNRVRESFVTPELRTLKIAVDGRELDAVEVSVTPFSQDTHSDELRDYVNKRYEFVFCDQIPGRLYSIHTVVPGEAGAVIDERLTFSGQTDAG